MASLLLWLSGSAPIDEALWQALAARASARCRHEQIERSGPGWRLLVRASRAAEPAPLLAIRGSDGRPGLLLLDRADGPDDRRPRDPDEDWSDERLFDGTPCAAIRVDPEARSATLTRDLLGQRSLVVAAIPDGVLVASGEDVLLAHPAVDPTLDETFIAAFLVGLPEAPEQTAFRGIRRLAPGETLRVDARGMRGTRRRVEPDPSWQGKSDRALVQGFSERLEQAVQQALRGADRVGLLLSAGLDSSALAVIAAAAERRGGRRLCTVTQGLAGYPEIDERALAADLARTIGSDHHDFVADTLDPFALPELRPICPDTPQQTPFREWKEVSYRYVEDAGVDVLLSGNFGDHLFAGAIDSAWDALRLGRWRTLAAAVAGGMRREGGAALWRTPEFRRIGSHLLGRTGRPSFRLGLVRPELGRALGERLHEERRQYRDFLRPAQAELLLGTGAAFDSHGEDWYANAHGIEFRQPYRHLALVRFCLSIPADLSLRDGERKWLLRQALAGRLPDALRQRPKGSDLTVYQEAAAMRRQSLHAQLRAPAADWVERLLDADACARLDPDERALLDWMALALGTWITSSR